jgi:hypothetical protein
MSVKLYGNFPKHISDLYIGFLKYKCRLAGKEMSLYSGALMLESHCWSGGTNQLIKRFFVNVPKPMRAYFIKKDI